ncbi:DBR1-domain-containing protein [Pluteus cervinus]|uniref:DBR1-domain-containing protein n=1 Tax=Pluteus cervinus TaxID=181527 RepID=A0ACD3A8L0_9AGAR|nr:DBR1-domain-containing protein [Pluteus cervinus]
MRPTLALRRMMKVAVEGCCHGELDAIYQHITFLERKNRCKVDLLLMCGDFEGLRNEQDMKCMARPEKYTAMGDFHKYYSKQKVAPILTLVIGGNHEASNYMWELYHGGWLAPNIYYLGNSGCVQVNGVRIGAASGIYKSHHYNLGHWETLPYDRSSMRSIYHQRDYDFQKLSMLPKPSIFLSHDWPMNIPFYGDVEDLLQRKSRHQIEQIGSPPSMELLRALKPDWWFSAHMHTKFAATVEHKMGDASGPGSGSEELNAASPAASTSAGLQAPSVTQFLALDKCLPNREFLEVIDVPIPENSSPANASRKPSKSNGPPVFSYDPQWLAILRAFHPWLTLRRYQEPLPEKAQLRKLVEKELEWVKENVPKKIGEDMRVERCQQFSQTAPMRGFEVGDKKQQPPAYTNPQTEALCSLLELENKINPAPRA